MRFALLIPVAALVACSGSGAKLSVSTRVTQGSGVAALQTTGPTSKALAIGTHVTLDRARILIRKVELESEQAGDSGSPASTPSTTSPTSSSSTSSASTDGSSGTESAEPSDSDGETEVHGGPYVIDLSGTKLDGGVTLQFESAVPAGTYDEGSFQIHKLTPGESVADTDFAPLGHSIILGLTVDGAPFTFTSDLTAVAEIDGPITVPEGGDANVTVTVDPSKWFTAPDGSYLDPTNEANRQQIEWNIKASIRGFEDDDHDGTPDHS